MTMELHADVMTSSINFGNGRQIGKVDMATHRPTFKQKVRGREHGRTRTISGINRVTCTKTLAGTATVRDGWGCAVILRLATHPAAAGMDATRSSQAVARHGQGDAYSTTASATMEGLCLNLTSRLPPFGLLGDTRFCQWTHEHHEENTPGIQT